VGGVAILTGGTGTALTSHLLFLFFGSSPEAGFLVPDTNSTCRGETKR